MAKECGMIFSGPMVRAIMNGTKTQTRRVIKPQPKDWTNRNGKLWPCIEKKGLAEYQNCPYGQIGNRIWVRETFGILTVNGEIRKHYKVDNPKLPLKWRPSIFMPRWASRIDLEILNIRVERIQDISEQDAMAEGVLASDYDKTYRYAFSRLWDSINAKKRDFGWEANPWVWVIEFKWMDTY